MSFRAPLRPLLRATTPSTRRHASSSTAAPAFQASRAVLLAATLGASAFAAGILTIKSIHPGTGPVDSSPLHPPSHAAHEAALISGEERLRANALYQALCADPEWVEQDGHASKSKLLSETYWGHRKITVNRRFLDREGRRAKSLLSIGTALCGHPNVVHGGVLATVLDEALGRLAVEQFPKGTSAVTAKLEVKYRRPTRARDEWFNREGLVLVEAEVVEKGERKVLVRGGVRDLEGNLLVESEALFVVPKGWQPKYLH
jgi:acyl-coenzyme A thioesterase PaaI-like protein